MHLRLTTALAITVCLAGSTFADDQPLSEAIQIIEDTITEDAIPGAAVLVMQDGDIVAECAIGTCDVETSRPFETDTICWIASLTKPVTATAAMTLVEKGLLELDDPVEKYLPEFRTQTTAGGRHVPVTIRQLMCHASGIQASVPLRPRNFFEQPWYRRTLAEVAAAIAETELVFEPGERAQYSNAAPYVLGRIIEIQARRPFGDYVRETILEPLDMLDTGFAIPKEKINRAATVLRRRDGMTDVFCRFDPEWDVTMTMPDGGLFSTTHDIARFAQSFLDGRNVVLSDESIEEMLTEQSDGYGLGWILDREGQFSHWGSSGTRVWGDRRTGVVGVVFFQIQDQRRVDEIQGRFRKAVTEAMVEVD
jgi:CubicO group peptidase (beta-lactamase class C family)